MPSYLRQNTRSKFWRLYTNAPIATEMSQYKDWWKEWIKPSPFLIVAGFIISGSIAHDDAKSVRSDLSSNMTAMENRLTNVIKDDKSDLTRLIDRNAKTADINIQAIRELTSVAHETRGYLKGQSLYIGSEI